jgi:hypothetical protein
MSDSTHGIEMVVPLPIPIPTEGNRDEKPKGVEYYWDKSVRGSIPVNVSFYNGLRPEDGFGGIVIPAKVTYTNEPTRWLGEAVYIEGFDASGILGTESSTDSEEMPELEGLPK